MRMRTTVVSCQGLCMSITMRVADTRDIEVLVEADRHVDGRELRRVIDAGRVTVCVVDGYLVGWLRWGLFWDEIPFINMLFVMKPDRGKGFGTGLIQHWEDQRRAAGYRTVMTATPAGEMVQHLYRRLGYVDRGSLMLPGEPLDLLLTKALVE